MLCLKIMCNFSVFPKGLDKNNMTCSDMFYLDQLSLTCQPKCGSWTPLPNTASAVAAHVTTLTVTVLGVLGCLCVLIHALLK